MQVGLSHCSGNAHLDWFAVRTALRAPASSLGMLVLAGQTNAVSPGVVMRVSGRCSRRWTAAARLTVGASVGCAVCAQHETAACQLPCGLSRHALLLDSDGATEFVGEEMKGCPINRALYAAETRSQ